MATYIEPNSTIELFKGINLDNRYLHTIYFANEAAQNAWFSSASRNALSFTNLMYRRNTSNSLKVQYNAQLLLEYTYMRFKNTRSFVSDGSGINPSPVPAGTTGSTPYSKWFYAFITAVDYVNENTSIIYYEIDVMQTWFIQNGTIRPCMVVREHVNSDNIGEHLEPEPVGSDSYEAENIPYNSEDGALFSSYNLIVNTSELPDADNNGAVNNLLVNGTKFYVLDYEHEASPQYAVYNFMNAIQTLINGSWSSGDKPYEVIDMFTFPSKFCSTNVENNTHIINITHPTSLGGYTPKNKKLYTYPYCFINGTTKDGEGCIYKWEYFDGFSASDLQFTCYGNPIGGGQVECYPRKYNGITNNVDAGMKITDFPKNPYAFDAYQAWVAAGGKTKLERAMQFANVRGATAVANASYSAYSESLAGLNAVGHNTLALRGTGTSIMDDFSGIAQGARTMVHGAASLVNTALDVAEAKNKIIYAWKDAMYQPNIIVGSSSPNLSIAKRHLNFYFFNTHVKAEELARLDDFFTCYGYAVNKVKTPNLTGRQYWNFVQTDKCEIGGDMPSSSKEAIGRIFDGGITFWHDGTNVGNYTTSNPII